MASASSARFMIPIAARAAAMGEQFPATEITVPGSQWLTRGAAGDAAGRSQNSSQKAGARTGRGRTSPRAGGRAACAGEKIQKPRAGHRLASGGADPQARDRGKEAGPAVVGSTCGSQQNTFSRGPTMMTRFPAPRARPPPRDGRRETPLRVAAR